MSNSQLQNFQVHRRKGEWIPAQSVRLAKNVVEDTEQPKDWGVRVVQRKMVKRERPGEGGPPDCGSDSRGITAVLCH